VKPYDQLPQDEKLRWLEFLLDHVKDAIVIADGAGRMVYVNHSFEAMTGWPWEEAIGRTSAELLRTDNHPTEFWDGLWTQVTAGQIWEGRIVSRRRDGENFAQWVTIIPFVEADGTVARLVAVRRDISESERREVALTESETRYALAARGANDGLWDWDLHTGELYLSPRWYAQLGEAPTSTIGQPGSWFDRVHSDDLPDLHLAIEAHRAGTNAHLETEYRARLADGSWRWMLVRGIAVRDEDGEAIRIAGSQTDISERKAHEERLLHNALHDALTGLPNRDLFSDRLSHAVRRLRRRPDTSFAVLFVDLDRFKDVNDSLGHSAGDQLLQDVTARLNIVVRPSDTVARLGGDEFTVLVEDIDEAGALILAERIREAVSRSFTIHDLEIFVTASIGVAMGDGQASAEELLLNADRAMYHAKKRGRSQSVVYDASTSGKLRRRLTLQQELLAAVPRGDFEAWFQPVVALLDGRLLGFEALARWGSDPPVAGPDEFIPLAEDLGLIVPLGDLILEQACGLLRRWQDSGYPLPELGICVNLSPRQFTDTKLVNRIEAVLERTGVNPKHLKLEITESTAMTEHTDPIEVCQSLRALGVSIAIDDFGTGYSSLSKLHQLPVQTLKVDQSFVRRLGVDREAKAIVRTILGLAQSLGLDVVAEGIETEAQRLALLELGCLRGQGWLFAKAERADDALRRVFDPAADAFDMPSSI
jgi:diguanylate cyclase (GGDEF)-like protein/PAS domain S-box-containing protein